jgi:hypothetical protein
MPIFTLEQGVFLNFATHFAFRCPGIVLFPGLRISEMQHVVLSIRYNTAIRYLTDYTKSRHLLFSNNMIGALCKYLAFSKTNC